MSDTSKAFGLVAVVSGPEENSAPHPHPEEKSVEKLSDKPLENLVAVPRIERVTRGL